MKTTFAKTVGIVCTGALVAACTANTTADIETDLDGSMASSEASTDVVSMDAGVIMEDGTMMVITVDGEKMEMTEDVMMDDGTKVTVDGEVLMTDGTKMMLKEGDGVSMDGEVMVKGQAMVGDESEAAPVDGMMEAE